MQLEAKAILNMLNALKNCLRWQKDIETHSSFLSSINVTHLGGGGGVSSLCVESNYGLRKNRK
jgi:hypothetical protein